MRWAGVGVVLEKTPSHHQQIEGEEEGILQSDLGQRGVGHLSIIDVSPLSEELEGWQILVPVVVPTRFVVREP